MVGVSASVNLPLHHKVLKFSSGTGLAGWSRKRAVNGCGVEVVVKTDRRAFSSISHRNATDVNSNKHSIRSSI